MPTFTFQLEAVLRQRKHIEQQRQRDVAIVQAQYAALEAELKSLNGVMQSTTDDVRKNHLVGVLDLSFLTAHRRYVAAVQRKAMGIVQKMAAVQKQIDDARKLLAEAAMKRKAVEKLKEKRREQWRTALAKKELAALDEVGMQLGYEASVETGGMA